MNDLFKLNSTQISLSKLLRSIDNLDGIQGTSGSDFELHRNTVIKTIIMSMVNKPVFWDDNCQINIEWIGGQFSTIITREQDELNKKMLDRICAFCFRFLFEYYLSTPNEIESEFESARNFVLENVDQFEHDSKLSIEYAIRSMPISIFKRLANSTSIQSFKDFNDIVKQADDLKESWDNELISKEKKVNDLKDSLNKYENAFNFVGLYQGFDDLSKVKKTEKDNILFWLRILALVVITPILAEITFIYSNIKDISSIRDGLLASIFPTISLVGISIYYFRVLLFNYKSVTSQLLQIELRKTLCRFIQSYSEYSTGIKNKDINSLDKFESIIFSGIVSDSDKMPSTFDGLDQVGKLIKSLK